MLKLVLRLHYIHLGISPKGPGDPRPENRNRPKAALLLLLLLWIRGVTKMICDARELDGWKLQTCATFAIQILFSGQPLHQNIHGDDWSSDRLHQSALYSQRTA